MKLYTWDEVVRITLRAGQTYNAPKGNYKDKNFCIKNVGVNSINKTSYLTLDQYKKLGLSIDVHIVEKLMKLYTRNAKKIPPIILDKNYNIIDGAHRMGAVIELQWEKIKAFVMC